MFVTNTTHPVTDDRGNVVHIRAKMNFGQRNRLMSLAAKINMRQGDAGGADASMDIGAYNNALAVENIVSWSGPDFENIPCTPETIGQLDPDDPLVEKVLSEINARNLVKKDPKERPALSAGG